MREGWKKKTIFISLFICAMLFLFSCSEQPNQNYLQSQIDYLERQNDDLEKNIQDYRSEIYSLNEELNRIKETPEDYLNVISKSQYNELETSYKDFFTRVFVIMNGLKIGTFNKSEAIDNLYSALENVSPKMLYELTEKTEEYK